MLMPERRHAVKRLFVICSFFVSFVPKLILPLETSGEWGQNRSKPEHWHPSVTPIDEKPRKRRMQRFGRLIALDAWLDSTLYDLKFRLGRTWESLTIASRKFHVTGWRRGVAELVSEAATLGTAGAVAVLALAVPVFPLTQGDWLKPDDISVSFLDRFGNEIGRRGIIQHQSVPVGEMPAHVINAVLATEDRRFFDHFGIDFLGLARALNENARAGNVVQGGSTLTQQLAKNIFLSNERTVSRKINEAFLAVWLEANLSKEQILQLYLDRAYMGGGAFGITAAAEFYFGKTVKEVALQEAAMLAGLFKAPARFAPHINLPAARARASEVLGNMVEAGFMTDGQIVAARREPANVVDRGRVESPDYFLDWAFDEIKKIAPTLPSSNLTVRTTFDPGLQEAVDEAIEYNLRQHGADYAVDQAAAVMMDNNGAVRAVVGGRDYGRSQFNRATNGQRPTGSSFKPYVYAAALEAGLTPETIVSDSPFSWGDWSPRNYSGGYSGRVNLTTALVKSINVVPARLGREIGLKTIAAVCRRMGLTSPLDTYPPMVLGTSGLTLIEQAAGYNVFANGGFSGTQRAFEQVYGPDGAILFDWAENGRKPVKVLKDETVKGMNEMLSQVPVWGTARRAALDGIVTAGKTGTTQDYRDAWYIGYSGNLTMAVWAGNDNYSETNRMTGGSLPAMIWKRAMTYAHRGIELRPIAFLEDAVAPEIKKPADGGDADGTEQFIATVEPQRQMTAEMRSALESLKVGFASARPLDITDPRPTASIGTDGLKLP
jgi:penicillin-binding protein 1A